MTNAKPCIASHHSEDIAENKRRMLPPNQPTTRERMRARAQLKSAKSGGSVFTAGAEKHR